MVEFAVILVFAGMQSIFGIGILFFGTPTLLILGHSFVETLSIVLPASMAVSLLQILHGTLPARAWQVRFSGWCLLPLLVALTSSLVFGMEFELELLVAIMLSAYVLIRTSRRLHGYVQEGARRSPRFWLAIIGLIHGISNLGGGLLAIFVSNTFADKKVIRSHIAFCYLCFATIQFSVLCVVTPGVIHLGQLGYAALAAVVFWILERRVFAQIPMPVFDRTFTALIGGYSALVFAKLAGILEIPAA